MKRNSWRLGRGVSLLALGATVALSACSGSGTAFRGAGSGSSQDISLVNDPDTGLDPELLEGVAMDGAATEPDTEITAYVQDEIPPEPDMATDREGAIRQIREKAASLPDEKPDVFVRGTSSVSRMSTREQEELKAELAAIASRNQSASVPGEAESKAAQIRRLREEARSHYQDALNRIDD